jgi:PPK2 family polyphosphate:nucleotide phosphotransferase
MSFEHFRVPPDTKVKLKEYPTDDSGPFKDKDEAEAKLAADVEKLADLQGKLYAQNIHGVLILLQGIDAAGKDSTIKHVMSGINPAGCQVRSFKVPTPEELDHDYLWRYVRALPERGNIGIFNRSYYEEVLVVRVHPELLAIEHIHSSKKRREIWADRFRHINAFEYYLEENGYEVIKFFLHLSKDEQKKRFLSRLDSPEKNWKFSEGDVKERAFWNDYQAAFEEMLSNTSTKHCPWYVIPADRKWFLRVAVADIVVAKLESMNLAYPKLTDERKAALARGREFLEKEGA